METTFPSQDYMEHADELAQEVLDAWVMNVRAGNANKLTADFKAMHDMACLYRDAKRLANNHRKFRDDLSESEASNEKAAREAFCKAYRDYWEKHTEN